MYTSVERGAGVLAVQPVAITATTRPDTRTARRNSIEAVSPTGGPLHVCPPHHLNYHQRTPNHRPPPSRDPAHSAHRLHPPRPNVDAPNGPMGVLRSGHSPKWQCHSHADS